jgi:hypothetical protein
MTYNLGAVRTRLQQRLDDTSFDTATSNQFINDGQRDILNSRRFTFMEAEASLTTTLGSSALTGLPSDFQVPITLRNITSYPKLLTYIEYDDFDGGIPDPSIVSNGVPAAWYIFANVPAIYPSADGTYTIKMRYLKKPTELTADIDVPEVPEEFSEVLVLAAYKRALEFNDENDKAQLIQLQVDELIEKMDERYKRQIGVPHIMKLGNRTSIWRF